MQELKLIWKRSNENHGSTSQDDKIVKIYNLACLMLDIIFVVTQQKKEIPIWLMITSTKEEAQILPLLFYEWHWKSGDDPKKVGRKALEKEGGTVKFNWIGNLTNMKYQLILCDYWWSLCRLQEKSLNREAIRKTKKEQHCNQSKKRKENEEYYRWIYYCSR